MTEFYHTLTRQQRKAGLAKGQRRRDEAFLNLAARRDVYILRGRRALLEAMLAGDGFATIDDVRERVDLPAEIDPVCFGAVPGHLARAGIIAADGFTKVTRREAHARPVQRWKLVDRAAAVAWLAAHPEPAPVAVPGGLFTMNAEGAR
jgi:hypothetical protein